MGKQTTSKSLSASGVSASVGTAKASIKAHLSAAMLSAGVYFAIDARSIEVTAGATPRAPILPVTSDRHKAAVLAAIVLSASFIEGAINEMFLHAADRDRNVFPSTYSDEDLELLTQFWEQLEEVRAPTLRKCQIGLSAVRKQVFDKGQEPYQSADALFDLRNAIVHFKPEWDAAQDRHAALEGKLRKRFEDNPFAQPSQVFFPHRCLGGGAAKWSCVTAARFVEAFIERLDVNSYLLPAISGAKSLLGAV
jgi:hypothetical protein